MGDPPNVFRQLNAVATVPGADAVEELMSTGLGDLDPASILQPRLASDLPTIENGLWQVFPDGSMQTTWRIRPNAQWHDGVPLTSADFVFTVEVSQDKDQIMSPHVAFQSIVGVETPDPQTVTVNWKQPYIEADTMFSHIVGLPLPKHLLARPFAEDRAGFSELPYWSTEFVGTGPFKLTEFRPGSHILLEANHAYALGRPRIDEIDVRIVLDANALMASILAGAVDLNLGRGLSFEQAMVIREQWKEGRADVRYSGLMVGHPQLTNPNPSVLADARFRRALLYAIDRQRLADALHAGLVPVAEVWLGPNEPGFANIESRIVQHPYDPRRASEILEVLGYRKGADGILRDGANARLLVETRSDPADIEQKSMLAVADDWQQLGVAVEPVVSPVQLFRDREYGATFSGFRVRRHQSNLAGILTFHGSRAPIPENRFTGSNYSRYVNAELDALIDRYFTTIPTQDRMDILARAIAHLTEQVVMLPLFYNTEFTLVANRLENAQSRKASTGSAQAWSSYEWDITQGGRNG